MCGTMKKLYVNHFAPTDKFSNGVMNYAKAVEHRRLDLGQCPGRDESCLAPFNKKVGESQESFQRRLVQYLVKNFHEDEVIIEAAESQSTTLLVPQKYRVHIRMHCPFFLYYKIIGDVPDQNRFSSEVRAMHKARYVSSPSYGMLKLLGDELDIRRIHVFKNPIDASLRPNESGVKDIDVILLFRFNKLKGIEYLNPILRLLPSNYNVFVLGTMEQEFTLDPRVRCAVTITGHVEGEEKISLLQRAKTSLSISKFENCSMVILESIATHVPVVCWDVGGNSEIARPPVINVVEFEDIFALSDTVVRLVEGRDRPSAEDFQSAIKCINEDYEGGSIHLERNFDNANAPIYEGIDFSCSHHSRPRIPYELRGQSWREVLEVPFNVLCLVRTKECLDAVERYFERNDRPVHIVYSGNQCATSECHAMFQFDWFRRKEELTKVIKEVRPDIILIEDTEFSSYGARAEFFKALARPVIHLFAHGDGFVFDKCGSYTRSLMRSRRVYAKKEPIITIKKSRTICAVAFAKETPRVVFLANKVRTLLRRQGIECCYVLSKGSDRLVLDPFFRETDDEIGLADVTDIFVVDGVSSSKYLALRVNLYLCEDDILENKNVAEKIDLTDLNIKNDIEISVEREMVAKLIRMRSLTEDNAIANFEDVAFSCLAQNSYKAMSARVPGRVGRSNEPRMDVVENTTKVEKARRQCALGEYEEAARLFEEAFLFDGNPNNLRRAAEAYLLCAEVKLAKRALLRAWGYLPRNRRLRRRIMVVFWPVAERWLGDNRFAI